MTIFYFHLKLLERRSRIRSPMPLMFVWLLCVLCLCWSMCIYKHVHTHTYIQCVCVPSGNIKLDLGTRGRSSLASIWRLDSAPPCPVGSLEMLPDLRNVFKNRWYSLKCKELLESIKQFFWRLHHQIAALIIKWFLKLCVISLDPAEESNDYRRL